MKRTRQITASALFGLCGLLFSSAGFAQHTDSGNGLRARLHSDLLTDQTNISKEINLLDSVAYLYRLQEEESQDPAMDLYGSWDERWVNPYRGMKIELPDSFRIDVTNYCIPTPGHITSNYGKRRRRFHYGVDLKVQTGDTIYAAFDGKVRLTRYERRGYGYYVVVRHNNGLETVYGHLSKFLVEPGQVVKVGEAIALGGSTGRSTGSHLHFETRFLGVAINPNEIYDFANQTTHRDSYLFLGKRQQKTMQYANGQAGRAFHKVRSGDTLGRIASKYGTSVAALCKINNISRNSTLRLGQSIRYR